MKDYATFTSQDFVLDKDFQNWVLAPTSENSQFWQKWLQQHPEKKDEIAEAKKMINAIPFDHYALSPSDNLGMWMNINSRIKSGQAATVHAEEEISVRSAHVWYRYAAVLLLPLVASLVYFLIFTKDVSIETGYGENQTVTLPDGSTVTLNAHSNLKYNDDWEVARKREVWLAGEAFFDVEEIEISDASGEKAKVKFVVHTPQVSVEVVGTEFNVKNRNISTEVVLSSGKILLKNEDDSVAMLPGERVVIEKGEKALTKTIVATPENYSAWKQEAFVFHNTDLKEVAAMLQQTYGFEVHLPKKEVLKKRISSIAPASTSNLDEFLSMLENLYDVQITKTQNVIQIE